MPTLKKYVGNVKKKSKIEQKNLLKLLNYFCFYSEGRCSLTWTYTNPNKIVRLEGFLHQNLLFGNVARTTTVGENNIILHKHELLQNDQTELILGVKILGWLGYKTVYNISHIYYAIAPYSANC